MNDTSTLIVGCAFGAFLLTLIIAAIAEHIKYKRSKPELTPETEPLSDEYWQIEFEKMRAK